MKKLIIKYKSVIKFIITFLLIYAVLSIAYKLYLDYSTGTIYYPDYFTNLVAKQSNALFEILGYNTEVVKHPYEPSMKVILENKAYDDEELMMPLERPNVNQSWSEFHALYKTMLALTGNVYIYLLAPTEGMNAGKPIAVYILPSHLIKIVTKDNISLLGVESPIKSYMLIEGKTYIDFFKKGKI